VDSNLRKLRDETLGSETAKHCPPPSKIDCPNRADDWRFESSRSQRRRPVGGCRGRHGALFREISSLLQRLGNWLTKMLESCGFSGPQRCQMSRIRVNSLQSSLLAGKLGPEHSSLRTASTTIQSLKSCLSPVTTNVVDITVG
jgi:hypothetical protein